ncbi:hypothetical protein DERP_006309 [Dermatophagoides pteronyssinus]|uniref:Uncharacterized protein n=1 Tax=Dermatophagoides pteronyssinus TaxID=6956 RepID=A0ABQ8IY45_DERPT|nr:hypothetical protein DERP_006309 [Dermatophagoides pteronyssinus]
MNKQQQQIFDSYNQKPDQNSVENGKRKLLTNIYNICPMNNMEKEIIRSNCELLPLPTGNNDIIIPVEL